MIWKCIRLGHAVYLTTLIRRIDSFPCCEYVGYSTRKIIIKRNKSWAILVNEKLTNMLKRQQKINFRAVDENGRAPWVHWPTPNFKPNVVCLQCMSRS